MTYKYIRIVYSRRRTGCCIFSHSLHIHIHNSGNARRVAEVFLLKGVWRWSHLCRQRGCSIPPCISWSSCGTHVPSTSNQTIHAAVS